MSTPIPPALKSITPYVQRGRELLRAGGDEVVAYHCFKHAMGMGIKLNDQSPEVKVFLKELITQLEQMNSHLEGKTQEQLKDICETFANAVFERADKIDKSGNADRSTALSFYASATFFEILKQFNENKEIDPDVKQLIVYSKWRASEIVKAIKEGRKPTPPSGDVGGMDEDEDHEQQHESSPPPPVTIKAPVKDDIPIARPATTGSAINVPTKVFTNPASSISRAQKSDILEYIKFSRAALEADDIPLTIQRLQAALELLHKQ